jgi:hypothetical protein
VGRWEQWLIAPHRAAKPPDNDDHLLTCQQGLLGIFLGRMEKRDRQKPTSPRCLKCGEQPKFTTSMLDPPTGRTFHMFECQCGNRTWISEKM